MVWHKNPGVDIHGAFVCYGSEPINEIVAIRIVGDSNSIIFGRPIRPKFFSFRQFLVDIFFKKAHLIYFGPWVTDK